MKTNATKDKEVSRIQPITFKRFHDVIKSI